MRVSLDSKALDKLYGILAENILPSFLTPRGTKLRGIAQADAQAHQIRALEQAKKDAKDIKEGRARLTGEGELVPVHRVSSGDLVEDFRKDSHIDLSLVEIARSADDFQRLQQFINLSEAISMALDESENIPDSDVSTQPMNPDWFTAWRDGAQRVSNKEMQVFWARILAGESAKPDSYSLHALELLRRLAPTDAKLIEKIAPLVIEECALWRFSTARR